jgi:hypothetical protein
MAGRTSPSWMHRLVPRPPPHPPHSIIVAVAASLTNTIDSNLVRPQVGLRTLLLNICSQSLSSACCHIAAILRTTRALGPPGPSGFAYVLVIYGLHMFSYMGPPGPSGFMRPYGAFVHMGLIGPHEPLGLERIGRRQTIDRERLRD